MVWKETREELEVIKKILKDYRIFPKKFLGQNFLIDKEVLSDIIKAAELDKEDIVIEIGPGLGILTMELAKRAGKVIAIEKDERLVKILLNRSGLTQTPKQNKFATGRVSTRNNAKNNVKIIQGDILKLSTLQLYNFTTNYKVVANLPYYITSPVIRKFLEAETSPKLMVLMVQKEVAERICALPPEMSLLAVACQLHSKPEIVRIVGKECFWPVPKVDGAIIKLKVKSEKLKVDTDIFFKIVKAGFSSPRKQIKNNLKKIFGERTKEVLKKAGTEPSRRAETLTVEEWIKMVKVVNLVNLVKVVKVVENGRLCRISKNGKS